MLKIKKAGADILKLIGEHDGLRIRDVVKLKPEYSRSQIQYSLNWLLKHKYIEKINTVLQHRDKSVLPQSLYIVRRE